MTMELWLAYAVAATIILTIPGPTILLVVSYALSHGRRAAFATVTGTIAGDIVAMVLSLAGLGALMSVSAALFTAVKWIGALYLIYLGYRMWRGAGGRFEADGTAPLASPRRMFWDAFTVTVLNPKSITFFIAFLPQFMNLSRPVLPQLVILGVTFLVIAFMSVTSYALLAGSARQTLGRPVARRLLSRLGGSILIGAGLWTALRRVS